MGTWIFNTSCKIIKKYLAACLAAGIVLSATAHGWAAEVYAWGSRHYGQFGDDIRGFDATPKQAMNGTSIQEASSRGSVTLFLSSSGTVLYSGGDTTPEQADCAPKAVVYENKTPLTAFIDIARGGFHNAALKNDGVVWTWGVNNWGQLGRYPDPGKSGIPGYVSGLPEIVFVETGYNHTVALDGTGQIWAWGDNRAGQLGVNDSGLYSYPTPLKVKKYDSGVYEWFSNAVKVVAGENHNLAIDDSGDIWAWGANGSGQIGNGVTTTAFAAVKVYDNPAENATGMTIAAGASQSYAILSDGILLKWGDGTITPTQFDIGHEVVGVSAEKIGRSYTLFSTTDGVYGMGANEFGQLGRVYTDAPGVSAPLGAVLLPAGDYKVFGGGTSHAIDNISGQLWAWGDNSQGKMGTGECLIIAHAERPAIDTTAFPPNIQIVDASAGADFTIFLLDDGTVWTAGANNTLGSPLGDGSGGASDVPVQVVDIDGSPITGITEISAGTYHSLALNGDGEVWAWGHNGFGCLGVGNSGAPPYAVKVQKDDSWKTPPLYEPNPLNGICAVEAGFQLSTAVDCDNGKVYTWGDPDWGMRGNGGSNNDYPTPVVTELGEDLAGVKEVSASIASIFAVKSDGTVWAWGDNTYYQLGDGTRNGRNYAAQVKYPSLGTDPYSPPDASDGSWDTSLSNVRSISGRGSTVHAILNTGEVYTWGYSYYKALCGGPNITDIYWPVPNPSFAGKVVASGATSGSTSFFVYEDGTVWSCGGDFNGLLGRNVENFPTWSGTPLQVYDPTSPTGFLERARSASITQDHVVLMAYSPLAIQTVGLPAGVEFSPYNQTLEATGGKTPYFWEITTGSLPDGLSLIQTTGEISGMPTNGGTYPFTVQVSSADDQTTLQALSITIGYPPLLIQTTSLSNGVKHAPYNQGLAATGGNTPLSWSIDSGTLPPGLGLDPATGVISGTPTDKGTYNFTVRVTSASPDNQTVTQALLITVTNS